MVNILVLSDKDIAISFGRQILKCHFDQILDSQFFTFSYIIGFFLDILANFNLSRTLKHMFLDLYFREFTVAINFPCFKSWLRIKENDVIFSKIPHGLKL